MYLSKTQNFFLALRKTDYKDSILTYCESLAVQQATYLDSLNVESISRLPLAGKFFTVKDNIDVAGYATFVGNPGTRYPLKSTSAGVIQCLSEAGAILVGKNLMNEFAAGLDGKNTFYPSLINPVYPQHLVGGSSSGGAVSVAAGLVDFALGTDTGGSVRIPACWTGSYGLRLAISDSDISGVFPRSLTFDSLGIITRNLQTLYSAWSVMRKRFTDPSELENKRAIRICFDPSDLKFVSKPYSIVFQMLIEKLQKRFTVIEDPIRLARERLNELALTVLMHEFYRDFSQRFYPKDEQPQSLGETVLTDLSRGAAVSVKAYRQAIKELFVMREVLIQSCSDIRLSPLAGISAPLRSAVFDGDHLRMFTLPWSLSGLTVLGVPVKIPYQSGNEPDGVQLIASADALHYLFTIAEYMKD